MRHQGYGIRRPVHQRCTRFGHFRLNVRKQLGQDLLAACKQDVEVTRLGQSLARFRPIREAITLHNGHQGKVIGQYTGG